MAQNNTPDNTHDVTPDDFDHLDVPHYTPASGAEQPATEHIAAQYPATEYPATETIAVDREPTYIPPAEPVYEAPVPVAETVVEEPTAKRGTIDLGLLLLRLCFGGYLIITALSTFFRWGTNEGISGLEAAYAAYPFGNGLAVIVPTLELAAGVFLVLGLIAPVAAAVAIVVTAFCALHAVVALSLIHI